jgi:hypothetical protein
MASLLAKRQRNNGRTSLKKERSLLDPQNMYNKYYLLVQLNELFKKNRDVHHDFPALLSSTGKIYVYHND